MGRLVICDEELRKGRRSALRHEAARPNSDDQRRDDVQRRHRRGLLTKLSILFGLASNVAWQRSVRADGRLDDKNF